MIPAEREWGLTIPNFVKTENNAAVRSMWNADGTIGYSSAACLWGCAATTPSGMVQWIMDGRAANDAEFATSLRWLADNWGGGPNEANNNTLLGYTYGMFAGFKALRLSNPPVERLTRSNGTSFDYYNDPAIGVAHVLTSRQNAATGQFGGQGQNVGIEGLYTQWSLLMLASSLFAQAPKAVAQANPVQVAINQEVTFDHSGSFHLNPDIAIALYEWDFDGDGAFDFQTANANERPVHRYNPAIAELPRVYTARLRVTDAQNPPLSDTADVEITVDSGNVPPVARITPADPAGPVGRDIAFSGATSFDPNAGAPLNDAIVRYEWDLDDSNGLVQFQDLGPDVRAQFPAPCGVEHQVALRVTTASACRTWPSPACASPATTRPSPTSTPIRRPCRRATSW
ncbi:MAG: PKD domain-containing protein [bacterium]